MEKMKWDTRDIIRGKCIGNKSNSWNWVSLPFLQACRVGAANIPHKMCMWTQKKKKAASLQPVIRVAGSYGCEECEGNKL